MRNSTQRWLRKRQAEGLHFHSVPPSSRFHLSYLHLPSLLPLPPPCMHAHSVAHAREMAQLRAVLAELRAEISERERDSTERLAAAAATTTAAAVSPPPSAAAADHGDEAGAYLLSEFLYRAHSAPVLASTRLSPPQTPPSPLID